MFLQINGHVFEGILLLSLDFKGSVSSMPKVELFWSLPFRWLIIIIANVHFHFIGDLFGRFLYWPLEFEVGAKAMVLYAMVFPFLMGLKFFWTFF
jgi:hypothetical protein